METAGYFTNLTGSSQKQKYVSLVLEEDKILSFKGTTLNKFVISTYDGETFETFTGTYSEDGQNLVLNFLTTTYNNYEIPSTIKIYVDGNYAILDGNKLMIDNRIASVYSNDTLSSLPSIFGDNTINFASLLIVRDNLSEFGVANQNKFMITGPKTSIRISGTINITDTILIFIGILFISPFISNICLSLRKSIWSYIVSIILLPKTFVCVIFNKILLTVSDGILFFMSSSDSISDFPNFTSNNVFLNSLDISESTLSTATSKACSRFLPDSSVSVRISKKLSAS